MITMQEEELLEEMDALPLDLKTKVVDRILNSLNNIDKDIDEIWINEVEERVKDIEANNSKLIDGEEVFSKLWKKFK